MSYDGITRDLCRKAQADVHAAVERICALLDDPADMMLVAISASAGSLASATGFVVALTERSTGEHVEREEAIDALWETLRPLLLKSSGGDAGPFHELLAKVGGGEA